MGTSGAKEIGKIFREAREKTGKSVEDVCRRSRIHMNVINDIENGVFSRLGKLYIKGFLKKYATFLKLDVEDILKKYASVAAEMPTKEFDLGYEKEKEKEKKVSAFSEKTIQAILAGILSIILIILVLVLIDRVKAKFTVARQPKPAVVSSKRVASPPVVKKEAAPAPQKKVEASTAKASLVNLTLKARGEVWLKVTEGDKTLFVGVLRTGGQKTFNSNSAINIWTGRAEMLEFTVNNRELGTIADGVIKNVKVSSAGITIDGNWVTRF